METFTSAFRWLADSQNGLQSAAVIQRMKSIQCNTSPCKWWFNGFEQIYLNKISLWAISRKVCPLFSAVVLSLTVNYGFYGCSIVLWPGKLPQRDSMTQCTASDVAIVTTMHYIGVSRIYTNTRLFLSTIYMRIVRGEERVRSGGRVRMGQKPIYTVAAQTLRTT